MQLRITVLEADKAAALHDAHELRIQMQATSGVFLGNAGAGDQLRCESEAVRERALRAHAPN